jgi:hypothetical protein
VSRPKWGQTKARAGSATAGIGAGEQAISGQSWWWRTFRLDAARLQHGDADKDEGHHDFVQA